MTRCWLVTVWTLRLIFDLRTSNMQRLASAGDSFSGPLLGKIWLFWSSMPKWKLSILLSFFDISCFFYCSSMQLWMNWLAFSLFLIYDNGPFSNFLSYLFCTSLILSRRPWIVMSFFMTCSRCRSLRWPYSLGLSMMVWLYSSCNSVNDS